MIESRPARLALGLLTRVPVDVGEVEPAELGAAVGYFAAVGALLGAGLVAAAELLGAALPAPVVAVLLVAALAAVTGGLHLDGVADVFDGLGGGRGDRQRALDIMKDPRVGAHGVVAVTLVVLAKVCALSFLLPGGLDHVWVFPIAGRAAATVAVVVFPSARADGLGAAFAAHAGAPERNLAFATLAVAMAVFGFDVALPAALALAVGVGLASAATRRLGGLTGDVYGAIIELAELAYLICALL